MERSGQEETSELNYCSDERMKRRTRTYEDGGKVVVVVCSRGREWS